MCKEGVDIALRGTAPALIWNLDGCYYNTATATTRRLKGRSRPAMGILEIEGRSLVLHDIKTDNLERTIALRTELRTR